MTNIQIETRVISSLEKVFADEPLKAKAITSGSMLGNELYSYQIAYKGNLRARNMKAVVKSELAPYIDVRIVGLVPSEMPCYEDHDEFVLRTTPGLFPDPLYSTEGLTGVATLYNQWRSLWVTVEPQGLAKPGLYMIEIALVSEEGAEITTASLELEIIDALLPDQTLLHTEWMHTDCVAVLHNTEVFSDKHWELMDKYIGTAAKHGINLLLTPIFTPPLDTEVGGERPTVQLVDVVLTGDGQYDFNFDKLDKWLSICRKNGITHLEFSHLFTQWGAKHAPKIMATQQEGQLVKIFGWETDASGEAYTSFLDQFLPKLIAWVNRNSMENNCFFHVSDEPHLEHLESYEKASAIIKKHVQGFPIIDALSDYSFYERGLVETPIPSNDHMDLFLEHKVEPLWTYYCCVQYKEVSNRFFNMPSARNRILGLQLYRYNATGFLHWGFNFWFSQFSKAVIDPFEVTDAGLGFASGDAYLVYPGKEGPIESIRLKVFYEALQDLRALRLLEQLAGRDYVLQLMQEQLSEEVTFTTYPRGADELLSFRQYINEEIKKRV